MTASERGLRVAVIGKGGTGKTVVAAGLARILAARGRRVLAADLDSSPGLAMSLGMPPTDAGLPLSALEKSPEGTYGWRMAPELSADEAVAQYASEGPGGIRYLGFGRISALDRESTRQSVHAVTHILRDLAEPGWDVIADLDAGPTGPFQRFHGFADQVVMVVGPAWASLHAARSLMCMVDSHQHPVVVFNRVPDKPNFPHFWSLGDTFRGKFGEGGAGGAAGAASTASGRAVDDDLEPFLAPVVIPEDPRLNDAERRGRPAFDADPSSPAMAALGYLASFLIDSLGDTNRLVAPGVAVS